MLKNDLAPVVGMRPEQVPAGCVRPADLVEAWVEVLVALSTAHNKDDFDAADATSDTMLSPILTAPIKQVRQFYTSLRAALEADPRIPFAVWMGFEAWGKAIIADAPDEGIKRLKRKLAADIAELAEAPLQEQLPEALKRALMWRDSGTLEKIKERLEAGEKPKLEGRESCLFLVLKGSKRGEKVQVML